MYERNLRDGHLSKPKENKNSSTIVHVVTMSSAYTYAEDNTPGLNSVEEVYGISDAEILKTRT